MKQQKVKISNLGEKATRGDFLRRVFFGVFAAVFITLFVQVVFNNMHFSYSPVWVIVLAVLWGALFVGLYYLFARFTIFFERKEKLCLGIFFALLVSTQVFFYSQVAAYPIIDAERVYMGAVNFTVNGFIEEPYLDYFYKYPNNMPLTIVLQFFFRIANMIGFTNFYVIGVLFNAFCILLAYTFVYLCCRRLFGVSKGFFALCLLYLCFPLQCYISVFYTDTITLFFAPFCFYLYLRMRDAKTWKGVLLAALIMTVGMAIGTKIKYSVVIAVIAVLVDLLLRLDWKKLLLVGVSFCVLFLAVNAGFNSFMYAHFLDKDTAKDAATPFTSWIMMGLKGDGAHNPDDNYLIWNWETAEEKQAQAASEIKNRLLAFTPSTFVKFYNQKALRSWGAGNLDIADWAGNSPVRETFLAAAIYEKSPTYATMDTISQGYYVALFAMVIVGAILACLKRDYKVFVPYLGIFGLFLFLLLWEAGQRYLVNYFGFYIIAAVFGTTKLAQVIKEKRSAEKEEVVEI